MLSANLAGMEVLEGRGGDHGGSCAVNGVVPSFLRREERERDEESPLWRLELFFFS